MQEANVVQRARAFVARVDTSNIRDDLSAYLTEANARVKEEKMQPGESGTTMALPDGRHVIIVNSDENEVRRRLHDLSRNCAYRTEIGLSPR